MSITLYLLSYVFNKTQELDSKSETHMSLSRLLGYIFSDY